ncbi:hypothetical protein SEVIR_8G059101v4 [Setaria viridis]|uniref:DC1 domain-containing protein n=1 Tax=Setaria viridis TaxID=4556 RepID=A0A4U6TGJ6_SETVI|nr:hypothetical protein SEVIR_8G059101v2 [Setaria viridis]
MAARSPAAARTAGTAATPAATSTSTRPAPWHRPPEAPPLRRRRRVRASPVGAAARRRHYCDACGGRARGLVYHCFDRDLDLHPCCAALRMESVVHGGHLLKLCGEAELQGVVCGEKQGRRQSSSSSKRFWAYRWCYTAMTA